MIADKTFEKILREFDAKQLEAVRNLQERKKAIYDAIPELKELDDEIASLSVEEAVSRISRGSVSEEYASKLLSLSKRKSRLLSAKGYSDEDLMPHYQCKKCNDTGYIGNELCSCFRNRITEELFDQSNIRETLKDENFDRYTFKYYSSEPIADGTAETPLSAAKKAVAVAKTFIADFEKSETNLFISGETGVGKTFLTNCIAKELIKKGYYVVYLSSVKLFDILSERVFRPYSRYGKKTGQDFTSENIKNCDLLIIDDLGTEMVNSFTVTQLFDCLNERLLGKKHTIISTNLSFKQLTQNYSERIASRIVLKYTLIKLFGDDIRMKKKLEG